MAELNLSLAIYHLAVVKFNSANKEFIRKETQKKNSQWQKQ